MKPETVNWLKKRTVNLIIELIEENYSDLKLLRGRREKYNPPIDDEFIEVQIQRIEKVRDVFFQCKFAKNICKAIPELSNVYWNVIIKTNIDLLRITKNQVFQINLKGSEDEELIEENFNELLKLQTWHKLSQSN